MNKKMIIKLEIEVDLSYYESEVKKGKEKSTEWVTQTVIPEQVEMGNFKVLDIATT